MNYFDIYLHKHNLSREGLDEYFKYDSYTPSFCYDFARKLHEKAKDTNIVLFSDFDSDGIWSAIVGYISLSLLGFTNVTIAERNIADGYALRVDIMQNLIQKYNPELIITSDVGITAIDAINYAVDAGVDVFVTDHHNAPSNLNDMKASVIVNYHLDSEYLKHDCEICGAMTIFNCYRAYLLLYSMEYDSRICDDFTFLRHFASIATISDSMPMLGSNRVGVIDAFRFFNYLLTSTIDDMLLPYSKNPIFQKFLTNFYILLSSICNQYFTGVDMTFLNFSVIPVVNAVKRMNGNLSDFYYMLLFADRKDAQLFAKKFIGLNDDRKNETARILKDVFADKNNQIFDNLIYTTDSFSGLYGPVAQKILEMTGLPAVVMNFTAHEDDEGFYYSGSVRSPRDFSFYSIVNASGLAICAGHEVACGITIRIENLYDFYDFLSKKVYEYIQTKSIVSDNPYQDVIDRYDIFIDYDADLYNTLYDIHSFMQDCQQYGPFGPCFPEPTILFKVNKDDCIVDGMSFNEETQKYKHTKIRFGENFQALLWNVSPDEVLSSVIDNCFYLDGSFKFSMFNGERYTDFVCKLQRFN